MFELLKTLPARYLITQQVPAGGGAWLVAETFYKFHSFTLECAAFLATWFVFDAVGAGVRRLVGSRRVAAAG